MTMIDLNTLSYFTSAFEDWHIQSGRPRERCQSADRIGCDSETGRSARDTLVQTGQDRPEAIAACGAPLSRRDRFRDHLATLEARLLDEPTQTVRIYCAPDMLMRHLAPDLSSLRRRFKSLQFTFTDDPRASDLAYVSGRMHT